MGRPRHALPYRRSSFRYIGRSYSNPQDTHTRRPRHGAFTGRPASHAPQQVHKTNQQTGATNLHTISVWLSPHTTGLSSYLAYHLRITCYFVTSILPRVSFHFSLHCSWSFLVVLNITKSERHVHVPVRWTCCWSTRPSEHHVSDSVRLHLLLGDCLLCSFYGNQSMIQFVGLVVGHVVGTQFGWICRWRRTACSRPTCS